MILAPLMLVCAMAGMQNANGPAEKIVSLIVAYFWCFLAVELIVEARSSAKGKND
jgi:hypothetical protein